MEDIIEKLRTLQLNLRSLQFAFAHFTSLEGVTGSLTSELNINLTCLDLRKQIQKLIDILKDQDDATAQAIDILFRIGNICICVERLESVVNALFSTVMQILGSSVRRQLSFSSEAQGKEQKSLISTEGQSCERKPSKSIKAQTAERNISTNPTETEGGGRWNSSDSETEREARRNPLDSETEREAKRNSSDFETEREARRNSSDSEKECVGRRNSSDSETERVGKGESSNTSAAQSGRRKNYENSPETHGMRRRKLLNAAKAQNVEKKKYSSGGGECTRKRRNTFSIKAKVVEKPKPPYFATVKRERRTEYTDSDEAQDLGRKRSSSFSEARENVRRALSFNEVQGDRRSSNSTEEKNDEGREVSSSSES